MQVHGERFVQRQFERFAYRGLDYCPYVQPALGAEPALFGGAGLIPGANLMVATNLPSYLRQTQDGLPPGIEVLARLPPGCGPEADRNLADKLWGLLPRTFAVGGDVGRGRVLVLADHSIFINEMLLPPDNDNFEFTDNCLEWLRGDDAAAHPRPLRR